MQQNNKKRKKKSSFYRRQDRWAMVLLAPWLIGVLLFFIKPLIETVIYSFNNVSLELTGVEQSWVGLDNYIYVLRTHATYYQELLETFAVAVPNTILIIMFSLFAAVLLNGKFKFRGAARVLFFLPIILATDLISVELAGVSLDGLESASNSTESMGGAMMIIMFLMDSMNIPKNVLSMLIGVVTNVFETIKLSGVQILIFLSGLQTVSPSMYEVAKMEGATAYETFWKVTLPTVSPLILTCAIYTITDNLMRTDLIDMIRTTAFGQAQYGYSAAMSVVFFICTLLVVGLIALILGKAVHYND